MIMALALATALLVLLLLVSVGPGVSAFRPLGLSGLLLMVQGADL